MDSERSYNADAGYILIADDTAQSLSLLSDVLRSKGYDVTSVRDGRAVLAAIKEQVFDLLLVDVDMPDISGYEICEQLKAGEHTGDLPVILLSDSKDASTALKAFDAGAVDYIARPFKLREVLARVANHVTLVQQRHEIARLREKDRQTYNALDKMKNEFLGMVTHDLKNPLNIMLGYTGLLAELDVMEHDQALLEQAVVEMRYSIDKMYNLVTSILDLVQIGTGTELAMEPVALQSVIEQAVRDYEIIALQKKIRVKQSFPEVSPVVKGDANRIMRVVDNLLSNALKYTPEDGHVEINLATRDGDAVMTVRDSGYGIPQDALSRLFDAFYRVDDTRHLANEGTGLGLAIVKTIVEQHNGVIDVESDLGAGSTFTVRLALYRERI